MVSQNSGFPRSPLEFKVYYTTTQKKLRPTPEISLYVFIYKFTNTVLRPGSTNFRYYTYNTAVLEIYR